MRIPSDASVSVQQAFREVWQAIDRLGHAGQLNVDLSGKRFLNCGDAVSQTEFVTKRQLALALTQAQRQAREVAAAEAGGHSTTTFTDDGAGEAGCTAAGADGHPTITVHDVETAGKIICGTGNEFPALKAIAVDQATRDANRDELLDRMVWHLNLGGFPASRYHTEQNRPWILLFNLPSRIEVAYRVVSYDTFETPMTTLMVFGGSSNEDVVVDAGTAD